MPHFLQKYIEAIRHLITRFFPKPNSEIEIKDDIFTPSQLLADFQEQFKKDTPYKRLKNGISNPS